MNIDEDKKIKIISKLEKDGFCNFSKEIITSIDSNKSLNNVKKLSELLHYIGGVEVEKYRSIINDKEDKLLELSVENYDDNSLESSVESHDDNSLELSVENYDNNSLESSVENHNNSSELSVKDDVDRYKFSTSKILLIILLGLVAYYLLIPEEEAFVMELKLRMHINELKQFFIR
jgi:hypothetical protein